ncbi:hypothetical protein [Aliarcobacter butzleri]|uniref:hypothetical protein n=1 Tax=Aliarcobacter butzleri TaxID=28197 RepID=UPI0021B2E798|nr:hypothetical protein [Aliarcobacter butzleri]MCT7602387.1 hypothetical protein [Aliarcobacter butzleri]
MKKPYLSLFEENLFDDINSLLGKTITETIEDTDNDIIIVDLGMTSILIVEN